MIPEQLLSGDTAGDDGFQRFSDAFMAWFSNLPGVSISSDIQLADLRGQGAGRGVVATSDIPVETSLFTIPRAHILTSNTSTLPERLPSEVLAPECCDPWTALILTLMYEHGRGATSPWKSYLDVLPRSFDTLMFWSEDELAELQASAVREKIGKEEADEGFRRNILPIVRAHPDLFFPGAQQPVSEEVVLALAHHFGSTIMAYAFDLDSADSSSSTASDEFALEEPPDALPKGMVPFADMLNSDASGSPGVNARLDYSASVLVMKTTRAVVAGEELRTEHGAVPRADLLRRFGYVTEASTADDVVEIARGLLVNAVQRYRPLEEAELEKRLAYLESKELLEDAYDIPLSPIPNSTPDGTVSTTAITPARHLPADVLTLLRTLLAPLPSPPTNISSRLTAPTSNSFKLAAANSLPHAHAAALAVDVGRVLMAALQTRLLQYATSAAADLGLLRETSSNMDMDGGGAGLDGDTSRRRVKMAIQVRLAEKQILANAMNDAAAMVRAAEAEVGAAEGYGDGGVPAAKKRRVV